MKRIILLILCLSCLISFRCFADNNATKNKIKYAKDYYRDYYMISDFSLNDLPNERFYRLSYNCKYIINDEFDFAIYGSNKEHIKIVFGNAEYYGSKDDPCILDDTASFFYKNGNKMFLLITQLHYNDYRTSVVYELKDGKLVRTDICSMQVDIVNKSSLLVYKSYWFIGFQTLESNVVINSDGKFEIIGSSHFVDLNRFTNSSFYTIKSTISYNKLLENKIFEEQSILKPQQKIRLLETDITSYIDFETEDGQKGRIKINRLMDVPDYLSCKYMGNDFDSFFLESGQYESGLYHSVEFY